MSLELKNISKKYEEKTLFCDFSHVFPQKGITVLCGDSGCGKTSLLRIIAGTDTVYDGKVFGGGYGNVSYCFQEYRLLRTINLLENVGKIAFVTFGTEERKKCTELLGTLGFTEREYQLYPDELSGGMKQRVALARALLRDAPILLLDEPFKELDPKLKATVRDLIAAEGKKRCVILTSHRSLNDVFPDAQCIVLS